MRFHLSRLAGQALCPRFRAEAQSPYRHAAVKGNFWYISCQLTLPAVCSGVKMAGHCHDDSLVPHRYSPAERAEYFPKEAAAGEVGDSKRAHRRVSIQFQNRFYVDTGPVSEADDRPAASLQQVVLWVAAANVNNNFRTSEYPFECLAGRAGNRGAIKHVAFSSPGAVDDF